MFVVYGLRTLLNEVMMPSVDVIDCVCVRVCVCARVASKALRRYVMKPRFTETYTPFPATFYCRGGGGVSWVNLSNSVTDMDKKTN